MEIYIENNKFGCLNHKKFKNLKNFKISNIFFNNNLSIGKIINFKILKSFLIAFLLPSK